MALQENSSESIMSSPQSGVARNAFEYALDSANTFSPDSPIKVRLVTSAALAVALHHLAFRKGEWHLRAPTVFTAWLLSFPLQFAVELFLVTGNVSGSFYTTLLTLSCFTITIFASIATHRLFFHPLQSFPGPKLAAVSKIWHSIQCLDGKNYRVLERLHHQYGDFVRTGPNEITIFRPEALISLDGPGNKTTKSVWYDFLMPDMGVTTIRDKTFHDQRRKIWTQAFSEKALRVYEGQMIGAAEKLQSLIDAAAKKDEAVNFSSLAYWFSFDVMGMFALSESFDMLNTQKWHYAVDNLRRAMSILGPLSPVPWLAQIGFKYLHGYWKIAEWHTMIDWCRDRMKERIDHDNEGTNIASYLIADARKRNSLESDKHLLAGEAIVAIVAGSDTVAPTLVFLFYQLAKDPLLANQLFEELQGVSDICDVRSLDQLPLLNAIINETLRFHPAVPTGGYRDAPPGGMTIAGRFIPGGTTIVAPRYTIFRSEKAYEQPDKFLPQRWYKQPELVKDKRSFLPFAQGRYTCLGKNLALAELRTVTSLLVSKFHINFAPGQKRGRRRRESAGSVYGLPRRTQISVQPTVGT
ncbi:hypothetical protein G7054_g1956 [Neopestalotiopsis clavispora]|nr:hypothetical protein G7054_g1956 [Neopestalotiopsis clavispora]